MKIKNIFLTIALLLIGFGSAMATPTTTQTREIVSGGGGTSTGGTYTNFSVVGEPVVGKQTSGTYSGSTHGFMVVFNQPSGSPRVADITMTYTGLVAPNFTATGDLGATFKWYSDITLLNEVNTGATFAHDKKDVGVYTYYVVQIVEGIVSNPATAKLTINKAQLTVKVADTTKIYGHPNPEFRIIYTGFVNGETASVIDQVPTVITDATISSNVYAYAVKPRNGSDNNYNFIYDDNGLLRIEQDAVSFTLSDNTKDYNGLAQSATIANNKSLVLGTDYTVTNNLTTNAGTYPLTITLIGNALINYNMTSLAVIGDLVINKVPLSITADNKSRCVGAANPEFTFSYSGFVNGETTSVITLPTATTVANLASPANTYDIVLNGGSATNYTITLVDGTLTVNALPTPTISSNNESPVAIVAVTYSTQSGMSDYVWTIGGTQGTDYTYTGGTSNTIEITWLNAGNKTVSVNYTNTNGCSAASATTKNVVVTGADVPVAIVNVSPLEQTVCLLPNVSATFNVELRGFPTPTVKWQELTTANGATWTDLTASAVYQNVTTTALTVYPIAGMSGYQYRAVGTNTIVPGGVQTANSQAVTLHITTPVTPTVALTSNPAASSNAISINSGTSVVFTATPSNLDGGTVAYQWTVNGDNVGNNQATFTTTTLKNNDYVNCVITVSGANICLTSATATAASPITATVLDVTGPVVTGYLPAKNSVVSNPTELKLTFDEPIMVGGSTLTLYKLGTTNTLVKAFTTSQVNITGNVLTADISTTTLDPGCSYYVHVVAGFVKDLSGNPFAGITLPIDWTFSVPISAPTLTPILGVTNRNRNSLTLGIGNPNPAGSKVLVVASKSSINWYPTDGVAYSDSLAYNSLASLVVGGEVFAVYEGTGSSCVVTGLTKSTVYYFKVFAFNGANNVASTYRYNLTGATSSARTLSKDADEYESGEKEFAGNFSVCKVNPNPVTAELNFCIDAQEEDNFTIELFNVSGELVFSQLQFLKSGSNTMKLDLATQAVGVSAGTYFLKVTANNESLTQQVVVIP